MSAKTYFWQYKKLSRLRQWARIGFLLSSVLSITPSIGSPAAEEYVQPAGQYEGLYKAPGLEAKVALFAGHSHAGIIVEYREGAGTPSSNFASCKYLLESKTDHTAGLVANFGTNNGPPSSPTCPKLLAVNLQPDSQHPNMTLELGAIKIRTSLSHKSLAIGSISGTTLDNVEAGGLKLSNTFREIQENLQANGFVIEAHDSSTTSGVKAYKNIQAYKPFTPPEIKDYCSRSRSSGIPAGEVLSIEFPYSDNMNGMYPIAIRRIVNLPPGETTLALDLEEQLFKKYGPPTTREANTIIWNYDKDGNVFTTRTSRDKQNIQKMQIYTTTKSGSIAEVIEGPSSYCHGPGQRFQAYGNFANYICSSANNNNTAKVDTSLNGYVVAIPNDLRCAFSLDVRVDKQQDKVERFSAVVVSRRNAVNALSDIEARELDLAISKTLTDVRKSREKEIKL